MHPQSGFPPASADGKKPLPRPPGIKGPRRSPGYMFLPRFVPILYGARRTSCGVGSFRIKFPHIPHASPVVPAQGCRPLAKARTLLGHHPMRSFLLFLWACSRLFGWRVRSTLCKLQLSPRAAPCYTYVIFMMMRCAILCKIATLPLETPRIVATLHRVLAGYLPLLPFALLEIRTGLSSCSAA